VIGVQSMASKEGGQSGMSSVADLSKTIKSSTSTLSGLDFREVSVMDSRHCAFH